MVPRTAVPSAIIASAVRLIPSCVRNSKYYSLILTRSIIGLLVAISLGKVHRRIKVLFGRSVAIFFMMITLSQPHFIFYASRPLPNIIVMPLGLVQITWGLTQIYASQMSEFEPQKFYSVFYTTRYQIKCLHLFKPQLFVF